MNRCPACEYLVPPVWESCRRCGAPLSAAAAASVAASMTAPVTAVVASDAAASAATVGTADSDLLPGRPAPPPPAAPPPPTDPDLLVPSARAATAPRDRASRRPRPVHVVAMAGVVALAAAGMWAWSRGDGEPAGGDAAAGVEILPPIDVSAPPSISDALRIAAEAGARGATTSVLAAYAQTGDLGALTPELLGATGTMTFVAGTEPSTGAQVASALLTTDRVVIAVAGEGDVCAFARVDASALAEYVTARTDSCRAQDAPAAGWNGTSADAAGGGAGVFGGGATP